MKEKKLYEITINLGYTNERKILIRATKEKMDNAIATLLDELDVDWCWAEIKEEPLTIEF